MSSNEHTEIEREKYIQDHSSTKHLKEEIVELKKENEKLKKKVKKLKEQLSKDVSEVSDETLAQFKD